MKSARALAHANIALAKYWGKANVEQNLPAVPSLSMTLDALTTTTTVSFVKGLAVDQVTLGGEAIQGRPYERVVALLDAVRRQSTESCRARVESHNNFPTAAGLASSASGFAALALAARVAAGLDADLAEASSLARQSSASAARSVYGGYVALELGAQSASRVATAGHFPLELLVALTHAGKKPIGSTEAMKHTARTSPYYPAWVNSSPQIYQQIRGAVLGGDLERLGAAVEQSALMMHASMLAAAPQVRYFQPATLEVVKTVEGLRKSGTQCYFTMDAGPHVKVITAPADASTVSAALSEVAGVSKVIHCRLAGDATVELQKEAKG